MIYVVISFISIIRSNHWSWRNYELKAAPGSNSSTVGATSTPSVRRPTIWAGSPDFRERSTAQIVVLPEPFAPRIKVCRASSGLPKAAEFLNLPTFLMEMIFLSMAVHSHSPYSLVSEATELSNELKARGDRHNCCILAVSATGRPAGRPDSEGGGRGESADAAPRLRAANARSTRQITTPR